MNPKAHNFVKELNFNYFNSVKTSKTCKTIAKSESKYVDVIMLSYSETCLTLWFWYSGSIFSSFWITFLPSTVWLNHLVNVSAVWLNVSANLMSIGHIGFEWFSTSFSLLCVSYVPFSFLNVPLHMSPQRTWVRAGKVTLTAFVRLFSTVCPQMSLQTPCMGGCKVTLVAFVWLFSTVSLQMSLQIACLSRCITTLVAFI